MKCLILNPLNSNIIKNDITPGGCLISLYFIKVNIIREVSIKATKYILIIIKGTWAENDKEISINIM